jgi:mRNA interferase MazF
MLQGMTPEAMREAFDWGPTAAAKSSRDRVAYLPEAGDLIWTDFDPRIGRGQGSRRPALVVSPSEFFDATEFAIVCPITSRIRPFGTGVILPPGLPVSGEIPTSHVRSIDTGARPIASAGCRGSSRNPQRGSRQAGRLARVLALAAVSRAADALRPLARRAASV